MPDLFQQKIHKDNSYPLSVRMRPKELSSFIGQSHILGEGKLLRRAIESDRFQSLIFYGPPGTGKTALTHIIANSKSYLFKEINAVSSNVSELRGLIKESKKNMDLSGKKTILFIDEIHRFNKAQQDVLMPDVERGNPVLIGATTYNPFFSIVKALVSRSMIFEFKPLAEEDIMNIIKKAISDKENGFGNIKIQIDDEALSFLAHSSEGDARKALNALEIGILTTKEDKDGLRVFDICVAEESIQKKALNYDKDGDNHYDTISAFIKSMRGSDADSAIYWLAKMLYAGEDPRFIARRIVICASEDVGNADPNALVIANAAYKAVEYIGMPEARIILAHAVTYVASSPKSNASYLAINNAMDDIEHGRVQEVPDHLKDAGYPGASSLGHGKGYKYAHDYKEGFVKQSYMKIKKKYYDPTLNGYEKTIKEYLERSKDAE